MGRPRGWPGTALNTLILLLVLPAARADAGAWMRESRGFYGRLSASRYLSRDEFDDMGRRQALRLESRFTDQDLTAYLEYGVGGRWTASTSFALRKLRSENLVAVTEARGLGDIDLGLRRRILDGSSSTTAAQLLLKVPTGYDRDVGLPLGNGQTECEARLLWGRSLWPLLSGYCGLEAGYRWRSGAPDDEFRYLVEVGGEIGGGFYLRGKLDGIRGRGQRHPTDQVGNPTVRQSSDLGVLDLAGGFRMGRGIGVEAGFAPALYGSDTAAGSTLSIAITCAGRIGGRPARRG